MKILNLHGLNGSCHNTNYEFLSKYYEGNKDVEIVSPQIEYRDVAPYTVINELFSDAASADIIVGTSFGGFFAYVLGYLLLTKTVLFNPCIPPHKYIGNLEPDYAYSDELKNIWNSSAGQNHTYSMLLGDSDNVLDINTTLNVLNPSNENYSIIHGGHSLKGEEYESWFKEQLK